MACCICTETIECRENKAHPYNNVNKAVRLTIEKTVKKWLAAIE